jgi:hypothetical protein
MRLARGSGMFTKKHIFIKFLINFINIVQNTHADSYIYEINFSKKTIMQKVLINHVVIGFFLVFGVTTACAEEVISIWSKGAEAYLSAGKKDLLANKNSIEDTETFLLRPISGKEISIVGESGQKYGNYFLEPLGNNFFAFKRKDGRYLSFNKSTKPSLHIDSIGDTEKFAVVPMRKGAKVCIRTYQGWEAKILVDHPADFPTLKANVNTLQITPLLDPPHKKFYSKELLVDYRKSLSTNLWETEYIIRKTPQEIKANPKKSSLRGLLKRVELMESLDYEVDYLIVYREPLVKDHQPGPWSDKRIMAQSDVDLINKMFRDAHAKGTVKHKSYRLVALVYQFDTKPANDSFCGHLTNGLDDNTRDFIKKNFWGLSVEINSHDYSKKNEEVDTAMAAEWCKANDLELIITSGGAGKDKGYKKMFEKVFSEFKKRDIDPASPWLHYVLHHVFQSYKDRLPEWNKDTTAENAKWLIEKVQKIKKI